MSANLDVVFCIKKYFIFQNRINKCVACQATTGYHLIMDERTRLSLLFKNL